MKCSYNKILLILVYLILSNFGCKPKDCHKDGSCAADNRVYPLGEAKNYLCFNKGSYWIYKNTKTGDLDTQVCEAYLLDNIVKKGSFNNTKHITVRYEQMSRTISSSFNDCNYYDNTSGYNPDAISFGIERTILIRNSSKIGTIGAYFYPFVENENYGTGSNVTTCIGLDSTLIVQGKTYYNVAKFDIDQDDIWYNFASYPNAVYYWAKDVGLIKRWNKSENYSWELIEYNIIK